MDETVMIQLRLEYLRILQEGKVRPDRNGGGYVKDSLHNIADIEGVKQRLNVDLGLDVSLIEQERYKLNNKSSNNDRS